MTEKPRLNELLNCLKKPNTMAVRYANEHSFYPFGSAAHDLYRSHQYHEDVINRHRTLLAQQQQQSQQHYHAQQQQAFVVPPPPPMTATTLAGPSTDSELCPSMSSYTIQTPTNVHTIGTPTTPTTTVYGHVGSTEIGSTSGGMSSEHQLCLHHQHQQHHHSLLQMPADGCFPSDDIYHATLSKVQSPSRSGRLFNKMTRTVGRYFLPNEVNRKYYADVYTCLPPPFFILSITLIELIFFTYYTTISPVEMTTKGPIPVDSMFIYRPDRRSEIWRYVLYMVLHAGWPHLVFNCIVQLLVGLPLEMVHGSVRVGTIYLAGVLAGSMATSVFDPEVYLVGASGGVYALLAAHIANVLLNYHQIELGFLRLVGVFLVGKFSLFL